MSSAMQRSVLVVGKRGAWGCFTGAGGWLAVYTGCTGKRFIWLFLPYMVCLATQVTWAPKRFSPNGYERTLVPLAIQQKQRSDNAQHIYYKPNSPRKLARAPFLLPCIRRIRRTSDKPCPAAAPRCSMSLLPSADWMTLNGLGTQPPASSQ